MISRLVLIRHLGELKTVAFLQRCLIHADICTAYRSQSRLKTLVAGLKQIRQPLVRSSALVACLLYFVPATSACFTDMFLCGGHYKY